MHAKAAWGKIGAHNFRGFRVLEATQKPDILKYAFMLTLTLFVIGLNASLSLKELAEGVMVILALFTIPRWREWPKFDKKFLVVMFLWVVGAFVSYYVFAPIDIPVEKTELPNFRWVFFFFAVVILAKFYLDWNWLQKMLAVVFAVSFVVDLVLFMKSGPPASGMTYNTINFANIIAPFVLISWAFVLNGFKNKKYDLWFALHVFCTTAGLFLVLMSQTRGVIIALIPLILCLSFFFGWKSVVYSSGFLVVGVIAVFCFSDSLSGRMKDGFSEQNKDGSRTARLAFWKGNYRVWQTSPLFGVGYGVNNFLFFEKMDEAPKQMFSQYEDLKTTHAHNQFIQILAGGGVWGLGLFLALLGMMYCGLKRSYRAAGDVLSRTWSLALVSALTCFLIAGGTEANFSVTKNRYIFVLLLAFIVAFIQQSSFQKTKEIKP